MARVTIAVIAFIVNAALMSVICSAIEKNKKSTNFIEKIPGILIMLLFILIILLLVTCFFYVVSAGRN